jgi:hypothetical protein
VKFQTVDITQKYQFAEIKDTYLMYAGCNVDGFIGDPGIKAVFSSSKSNFYTDTVYLDLGIVTNTGEHELWNPAFRKDLIFRIYICKRLLGC